MYVAPCDPQRPPQSVAVAHVHKTDRENGEGETDLEENGWQGAPFGIKTLDKSVGLNRIRHQSSSFSVALSCSMIQTSLNTSLTFVSISSK